MFLYHGEWLELVNMCLASEDFSDSSKANLKLRCRTVVMRKPVAMAVGLKETYKSMELILKMINYTAHNWNIWSNLKVISLYLGLH